MMKRTTITLIIMAFNLICFAQTTKTKYYNNEFLEKEVSEEKAKYSKSIIHNPDSTITTEIRNIKKGNIHSSETYKGIEPYGTWVYQTGSGTNTLDYNFNLEYKWIICTDSLPNVTIKNYFEDVDSIGYQAPKIENGSMTFYKYIAKNLVYPQRAKEEGIQGKTYLNLTITLDGTIENITVIRSSNILLDKEAVRVLRRLKFTSPPTLKGQKYKVCFKMPLSFKLM